MFLLLLQLSQSTLAAAKSAVKAATALWGSQSLGLLEAEDRLSVACEKGDTQDEVLLQLRQAYQVGAGGRGVG
jgi:preprotein translocase subunit SecA